MEALIKKRIEEAAHEYIQSDAVAQENMQLAFGDFINGAKWSLRNQWISVDETLPEKRQDVLVAVLDTKSNTCFLGFDNIDDDNGEFLRDKNGFAIENDSHKITHWMEIPSLKGGEE